MSDDRGGMTHFGRGYAISTKYERKGKTVQIVGLNATSAERHERLTGGLTSH